MRYSEERKQRDRVHVAARILCVILANRSGPQYSDGSQFDEMAATRSTTCRMAVDWADSLLGELGWLGEQGGDRKATWRGSC